MFKHTLTAIIFSLIINGYAFAAGSSSSNNTSSTSGNSSKIMTEYDWAEKKILKAKKLEKKGKIKKAKKIYKDALKNLKKAYKKDTINPDIYNYLGFTERKLGNYIDAEMYYLIGLEIDPKHFGINEYLGELYVQTNRIDLANERLKILENCNCEEYNELKEIIAGTKESKY
jgi:tetratricopeptide (TPR) repeat protein